MIHNFNIASAYIQRQYIGCYGDGPTDKAFDVEDPGGKAGQNNGSTNSNEFCVEICSINEYTYAGMQVSSRRGNKPLLE